MPAKALSFRLREQESARFNADKISSAWKKELEINKDSASVLRALWNVYGMEYTLLGLWKLIWAVFTWLGAYYFLSMT